jgi:hypothetical protein
MPAETLTLFEPAMPSLAATIRAADHLLVKTLVGSLPGEELVPQWHAEDFDECYVLVRDPRDRLISLLLFLPLWSNATYPPLWQAQPTGLARYLDLLQRKVAAPARVATATLFKHLMWVRFRLHPRGALPMLQALQHSFLTFHSLLPRCETVYYEDLIRPVVGQVVRPPPRPYARILRRGTPGEWRHWFTPEDVDYFRPVFHPYLTWYGYEEEWDLADQPCIRQATSTQYIEKWVRVDRRRAVDAAAPA